MKVTCSCVMKVTCSCVMKVTCSCVMKVTCSCVVKVTWSCVMKVTCSCVVKVTCSCVVKVTCSCVMKVTCSCVIIQGRIFISKVVIIPFCVISLSRSYNRILSYFEQLLFLQPADCRASLWAMSWDRLAREASSHWTLPCSGMEGRAGGAKQPSWKLTFYSFISRNDPRAKHGNTDSWRERGRINGQKNRFILLLFSFSLFHRSVVMNPQIFRLSLVHVLRQTSSIEPTMSKQKV